MCRSYLGQKFASACLSACICGAWGTPALALDDSDKEAIRVLSNQAVDDFEQNRFEDAYRKFLSAYETAKVPRLALWAARAQIKLGRFVAAYELYRQAIGLQPNDLWRGNVQQQAQQDARSELDQLIPRIPRFTILLQGAPPSSVAVAVDDVSVPGGLVGVERMIDPGSHTVTATRGTDVVTESLHVAEAERKQVVLTFSGPPTVGSEGIAQGPHAGSPNPRTAPSIVARSTTGTGEIPQSASRNPQRTAGWVAVGIGAAGLLLGTGTGIYVAAKHGSLERVCGDGSNCPLERESDVSWFNAMRTLSGVGFVVAGVGAVTGATLVLTSPNRESKTSLALWVQPQMAGVNGAF